MRLVVEKGKKKRKIEIEYERKKVVIAILNDNLVVMANSNVDVEAIRKYVDENLEEIVQDLHLITYLSHQLVKRILSAGKVRGEIHAK